MHRFQCQLELWLPNDDSDSSEWEIVTPPRLHTSPIIQSEHDMFQKRNRSIGRSFQAIKEKALPGQTQYIFEILAKLQHSIQSNCAKSKRDHASQKDSATNSVMDDDNQTPKKRSSVSGKNINSQLLWSE